MIFVNLAVTIIISIIDWTIVNIIVWSRSVTHSREQWPCGTQRRPPFELVIAIEVDAITALVNFLIHIRNWSHTFDTVVTEILAPSCRVAIPTIFTTKYLAVVAVAVDVEHRNEVNLACIHEVCNLLLGEIFVDAEVAGPTGFTVAIGILETRGEGKAVAIIVKLAVSICIAPWIFIDEAVAIIIDASLTIVVSDGL